LIQGCVACMEWVEATGHNNDRTNYENLALHVLN